MPSSIGSNSPSCVDFGEICLSWKFYEQNIEGVGYPDALCESSSVRCWHIVCLDFVFQVMLLISLATDALGVLTISIVFLTALLGLVCIFSSLYFQIWIRRRHYPQLSYFNGPWIIRIILILVSMCWGFGEISRLSLLRSRLFSSQTWEKNICKIYILSNLGFAEPCMFIMLSILLHAALEKRESDTLSRRWNRKTLGYVLFFCFPILCMQIVLVLVGPRFSNDQKNVKIEKFFKCAYSLKNGDTVCAYPLLSTMVLGGFYALLITYITYVGSRLLTYVINKGLRRRISLLVTSIFIFLPLRTILLGVSVLPRPGNLLYDAVLFLAFLMLTCCILVGICTLAYLPVADSLALRDIGHITIEAIPYNDYYCDGASLITDQDNQGASRNSDGYANRNSMSYRSMNLDGFPTSEDIARTRFSRDPSTASSQGLPPPPGRSVLPL